MTMFGKCPFVRTVSKRLRPPTQKKSRGYENIQLSAGDESGLQVLEVTTRGRYREIHVWAPLGWLLMLSIAKKQKKGPVCART